MTALPPEAAPWPPFSLQQLPIEVHGLLEDFQWAATPPHPGPSTVYRLTVVVPCFNPDPHQFAQLLLSLRQQSDQTFHLLLVNDGSSPAAWALIQAQLEPYPWIQVLHQPGNTGISAALNAALALVSTPYVALVDQDDILHPGAMGLVRRHLESHPDCGLLYSDHLVFDDAGTGCHYIQKFPWNPEALLEFNFLIHLTVVRTELYRASGGMNPHFDGIQDWEFYLRLASHLADYSVGYLPVPLYAWRLSDLSVASSARPKARLLELAQEFLTEAHARSGSGSLPAQPDEPPSHYRFLVNRAGAGSRAAPQPCQLLVLASDASGSAAIAASVQSVVDAGLLIARVFIALETVAPDRSPPSGLPAWRDSSHSWPEPVLLASPLADLEDQLPGDAPLLVLQAGTRLCAGRGWRDLPGWLERSDHWDLLTLPGFDPVEGSCVSAGYSSFMAGLTVYLPHGQGLTREAYAADFASCSHTRAVDLPSPVIQLLSRDCLGAALEAFRRLGPTGPSSVPAGWWARLAALPMRCGCPADLTVELSPTLVAAERARLVVPEPAGMGLISRASWFGGQGQTWMLAYGGLVSAVLERGAGRIHPLHAHALLAAVQHPAVLMSAERCTSRFSLVPPPLRRPVVMLIPTELNARSNGHACLLTLALQLQAAGHPVHLLPFKPYSFFQRYLPHLPKRYRQLSFIADPKEVPGGVLLAPESAPRQLVRRLRSHYDTILWWLLAPAGLLTPFRPDIRPGDKLVAFSEFALPNQLRYLFVHPRAKGLLLRWATTHIPQSPQRLRVALYTGKGRLKPLPRCLHRHLLAYQVVLITRSSPATKQRLVRLLAKSNGLISCDPMTNLSLEAATLGVPTFLPGNPFPARCYRHFPVDLRPFITDSAGAFILALQDCGPRRKLSSELLNRVTADAPAFVELVTTKPEAQAARAFRVTEQTVQKINLYRSQLARSRAIQVALDGQSFSSAFSALYARSLKAPYALHCMLCHVLAGLDQLGDLLVALGLFRIVRPLFNWLAGVVHRYARHLR